jgi:hypothetical protein
MAAAPTSGSRLSGCTAAWPGLAEVPFLPEENQMLRDKIQFGYAGKALAEACERKRDHHQARAQWWGEQLDQAKDAFREGAVEVREQPVTGGTRLDAVVDPEKRARLNECEGKVSSHHRMAEEYDRWACGFRNNLAGEFTVDAEDIAYFGL